MQNINPVNIVKASGIKEPFSEEKVVRSLSKSGLSLDVASQTVDYLKRHLKPEMTTDSIYGHITSYLQKNAPVENYFNYGLKRAVMDLGPSGFPFEILVSEVLKKDNFKTEVGVVTQGKCITHEIDVIAQKEKEKYFIECKFHNAPGYKTDVQVSLYSYARFLDINEAHQLTNKDIQNYSWLITNTKITADAYDYSRCVGLKITSWTKPEGEGLQDMIIKSRLHPITLITHIPKEKIRFLLDLGIVTCSHLKTAILNNETHDLLSDTEKDIILDNINQICK
ncbi:MAG TPA: restriction endonuclease [Candidatus Woesebacteria bacterium]|nr:restriction endonuclease [Candidatus Woesebacteria bacterium]